MKIETGLLWGWDRGEIYRSTPFLYVEPKLKTSKNTDIGLRMGVAENSGRIHLSAPSQFFTDNGDVNSVFLIVPTFTYYFIKNRFRPYLGLGLGYYFLTTNRDIFLRSNASDVVQASVRNQIGLLLRGGFHLDKVKVGQVDLSKFTVGLEYNYIPKADIETSSGQLIGSIANSNVALSIGYTVGK